MELVDRYRSSQFDPTFWCMYSERKRIAFENLWTQYTSIIATRTKDSLHGSVTKASLHKKVIVGRKHTDSVEQTYNAPPQVIVHAAV